MTTDVTNGDDSCDQPSNSNSNDFELRQLVYHSLEREGLITRLKAQLRAAVFKTIEKSSNPQDSPSKPGYEGLNGQICRALFLDWIEHAQLLYTQDILQVETSGPNHPPPITKEELLDYLKIDAKQLHSQPILHVLLERKVHNSEKVTHLPDYIKQSIDAKFPTEKIHDINRVREHFRSLFSSAFDINVLDTFINKNLTSTSISKFDYEQLCLKWIQSCEKVLSHSTKPETFIDSKDHLMSRNATNNGVIVTRARRSTSPPSESSSSSASSSSSQDQRKNAFDFPLPTTTNTNKTQIKTLTNIKPPTLHLNNSKTNDDDDDDDTTSSIFSKRNATPAALNHLKNIEDIVRGDETPRTRTIIPKLTNSTTRNIPIEYDDESMSQVSTTDDVTVDRASPTSTTHIDFMEDL